MRLLHTAHLVLRKLLIALLVFTPQLSLAHDFPLDSVTYLGKAFSGGNTTFNYQICPAHSLFKIPFSAYKFKVPICDEIELLDCDIDTGTSGPTAPLFDKKCAISEGGMIFFFDLFFHLDHTTMKSDDQEFLPSCTNVSFTVAGDIKDDPESARFHQLIWNDHYFPHSKTLVPGPQCMREPTPECTVETDSIVSCQSVTATSEFSSTFNRDLTIDSFNWTHTCGTSSNLIATGPMSVLTLSDPGIGKTAECEVMLEVIGDGFSAECEAPLRIPGCELDCLNQIIVDPFVDKGSLEGFATEASTDGIGTIPRDQAAVLDECGECDGDGTSCISCIRSAQDDQLLALDAAAFTQRRIARSAIRLLRRTAGKAAARGLAARANELYDLNWSIAYSIPPTILSCEANSNCTNVSAASSIVTYSDNASSLLDLANSTAREARRRNKRSKVIRPRVIRRKIRRIMRRAQREFEEALTLTDAVVTTTDICA